MCATAVAVAHSLFLVEWFKECFCCCCCCCSYFLGNKQFFKFVTEGKPSVALPWPHIVINIFAAAVVVVVIHFVFFTYVVLCSSIRRREDDLNVKPQGPPLLLLHR